MGSEDTTITSQGKAPERIGRFRILEPLGRGGMGVVFRAFDEEKKDIVALKLMQADPLISASGQTERFRREGSSLHKLTHPNIVPVVETGEANGYSYIALELIEGGSLNSADPATLSVQRKLEIARDVARALAHAHSHGVVHRDVKPSNILLRRDGTAVLTDFGLARDESRMTRLTQSIALLGTPAYMSPEQAQGVSRAIDWRTDVWSLGVVLFELFAGRLPFDALDVEGLVARIREDEPPSLLAVAPDTPSPVAEVVTRAMRRDPEERFPSMEAFAEDLDRLIRGERPAATRDPLGTRFLRAIRRRRGRLAMCGAAAILLGATGVFRTGGGPTPEERSRAVEEVVQTLLDRETKPLRQMALKLDDNARILSPLEEMKESHFERPDLKDIRDDLSTELQTEMLTNGVATIFDADLHVFVSRGPRIDQPSVVPVFRPTPATARPGVVVSFPRPKEAWIVEVAALHSKGESDAELGWAVVGVPFPLAEASAELKKLGAAARMGPAEAWKDDPGAGVALGEDATADRLPATDASTGFEQGGRHYQEFLSKVPGGGDLLIAVSAPQRPRWVFPLSLSVLAAGGLLLLLALLARMGL